MKLDNTVGLLQASPRQWSCHVPLQEIPDSVEGKNLQCCL